MAAGLHKGALRFRACGAACERSSKVIQRRGGNMYNRVLTVICKAKIALDNVQDCTVHKAPTSHVEDQDRKGKVDRSIRTILIVRLWLCGSGGQLCKICGGPLLSAVLYGLHDASEGFGLAGWDPSLR